MNVLCWCISLWRVYQVVILWEDRGKLWDYCTKWSILEWTHFGSRVWTYQNLAFDVSKLHIIAYILNFVWFNFAKFHVTCHFWKYVSIELCWTMSIESFSKRAQQSYFEIVFEIIYLLNCKHIQKYMALICNSKLRWWRFSFLVFKAFFFRIFEVHMLIKPSW
jgi:hypothetical protein